jgi:prepilin-type N-terminal cleavage/methylation domain-containing protein
MNRGSGQGCNKLGQGGFTLIELVIIIVVLGILAAVAVPKFTSMSTSAKIAATKEELVSLRVALVGNPSAISGGEYINRGFEGDVGYLPSHLQDLVTKPDSIATYNRLTRIGWNGPYVDGSNASYLSDAWGVGYVYEPGSRRIRSTGGGVDSLSVTF